MNEIIYKPIGIIYSQHKEPKGTPIQPAAAKNIPGRIKIYPEYVHGLKDLEGFSHIILLYHFHLSKKSELLVKPFMDDEVHGVFATRASGRPNPIGLSIVRIEYIEEGIIGIKDVDIVDQTPLIDIKPYVPEFDKIDAKKISWLGNNVNKLPKAKDDGRFI
jgi:tRNA (adenine37-N6)-methyltransferase